MDLNILSTLVFLPLISAVFLLLMPLDRQAVWRSALILSVGEFLLSFKLLYLFDPSVGMMQLVERKTWIPSMGVSYILGVDGISLWLVVLTAALMPIIVLCSLDSIRKQLKAYLVSMFLLQTAMMGSFLALDLILFFLFWELMLVPMAVLIGVWGGERRIYSAIKFFLYTGLGSALMLVSILSLAFMYQARTGGLTFDLTLLSALAVPPEASVWLFLGFALAFAIKVPVFPLHTWLPDAHTDAPTGGSIILAGVLLKFGVYGFMRFCFPLFPDVSLAAAPILAGLGVVGILYGALVCIVQNDLKRMVAFSSVSHLGFCMLGLFSWTIEGMAGCVYVMLAHGISTGALFLLVGFIYDRRHTRELSEFGGLAQVMPFYAAVFVITALASAGLPGLCGFIGEFLSLTGSFVSPLLPHPRIYAGLATGGVILAAVYLLGMVQRTFFGPITSEHNRTLTDLTVRERCAILPLIAAMLWMGVYPETILSRVRPSLQMLKTFVTVKRVKMEMERQFMPPPIEVAPPAMDGKRLTV